MSAGADRRTLGGGHRRDNAAGCMKNLSLSGALLKADVDFGLNALIKVSIKMPSPSQRAAAITAYISRKDKEGVGVEWCEFAPAVIKDLLRSPSIPLPSSDSASMPLAYREATGRTLS
jgi:hypothetical protein